MKSKQKKLTKKIILGKFKGKVLNLPSKITTRSSKSIVLESFFNTLQFKIVDSILVELFSGSGSIGLEALSRGAKEIIFMEKDREALKTLESNIALTDPHSCTIFRGDTFINIGEVIVKLKKDNKKAFFYIDPPFSIRDGMGDIYDKTIALISSLPEDVVKLIIIEHMTGLEIPKNIGVFKVVKSKKFGNTTLTYLN